MVIRRTLLADLSGRRRRACGALTTDRNLTRHLLQNTPLSVASCSEMIFWTAHEEGEIVAVMVANWFPQLQVVNILDLAVAPTWQTTDIAITLVETGEAFLRRKRCRLARAFFSEFDDVESPCRRLLDIKGWSKPSLITLRYTFNVPSFESPWLRRHFPLPKGCEIFFWHELSDEEWHRLRYLEEQFSFPPYVSPVNSKLAIEPSNSLGLRYDGEIVGWLVTHRLDKKTVSYSAFFLRPSFRMLGCALVLLTKSILLQKESQIPDAVFEVGYQQSPLGWIRFIERHLAPYSTGVVKTFSSSHSLG